MSAGSPHLPPDRHDGLRRRARELPELSSQEAKRVLDAVDEQYGQRGVFLVAWQLAIDLIWQAGVFAQQLINRISDSAALLFLLGVAADMRNTVHGEAARAFRFIATVRHDHGVSLVLALAEVAALSSWSSDDWALTPGA